MPNYRRPFQTGGTFFFTVVTFDRRPILTTDAGRAILHNAVAACGKAWPFSVDAMVLLPDHLHAIWTMPPGDAEFSKRWAKIKRQFSSEWLARKDEAAEQRRWNRRRSVWQPRFYDHLIRDEDDLQRHFDYLHFNPMKHGHATCPHAWPWSTFERCVRNNIYAREWACSCNRLHAKLPNFDWAEDFDLE